jgi:hypothetical protein
MHCAQGAFASARGISDSLSYAGSALIATVALYYFGIAVYCFYFYPLSRLPGRRMNAISSVSGTQNLALDERMAYGRIDTYSNMNAPRLIAYEDTGSAR